VAVYSLILAFLSFLTVWLCGAGTMVSAIGAGLGFLAFQKSKKLNGSGRGLAIGGMNRANGAVVALGLVLRLFLGGAMVVGGSS